MYAKFCRDILKAVGREGSRYTVTHNDSVACLPLPSAMVSSRDINAVIEAAELGVVYAEIDFERGRLRVRVDEDASNTGPGTFPMRKAPYMNPENLSYEDKENVRRVASALTTASIDGVQPSFEIWNGLTTCHLFACSPASKYDHLILMDLLRDYAWSYDVDKKEVVVVIPLQGQPRKRRKK